MNVPTDHLEYMDLRSFGLIDTIYSLDLLQYSFDDVVLLFAIPQVVKDSS
ncbi:hypothetical protein AM1_0505 [Acaryochloris marina MBIC11017]|uniref:Uncharacterized protein n=1 Tax=Acaryochloris marina (strain MBIC 11017) TaxID=329726 RepID=B0CC15_ACAM1|nr:hypothetical protein AM1_0505 [Acaryochloris marina MBIC11017]